MRVIFKGKLEYLQSISDMETVVQNVINGAEEEIWFVDYDDLYTSGSGEKFSDNNDLIDGIPVFQTNRGGKITYHGRGQRVIYFILDLKKLFYPEQPDISKFISILEELMIDSLREIGIKASILDVNRGVWCGNNKIGAIGIRLKKWVSYHGLALNVNTDLSRYYNINPCGLSIDDYGVTSIAKELDVGKFPQELIDKILIKKIHVKFNIIK